MIMVKPRKAAGAAGSKRPTSGLIKKTRMNHDENMEEKSPSPINIR